MVPVLSANAIQVMNSRICIKDKKGNVTETPMECFARVAMHVANGNVGNQQHYFDMLCSLDFLPNSPTLVNAGRTLGQLSACFVLPVEDSITGIFEALKNAAIIHKSGGGTGFSFGRLRSRGSSVDSTSGIASGPVGFMEIFDKMTDVVKQGGVRRGANMGILPVNHPDIYEFIHAKDDLQRFQNFNISVAVTDDFWLCYTTGETSFKLTNGVEINPQHLMSEIYKSAWKTGDPGLVFIDRINASQANPTPFLGPIEATNPCGEAPLYPFDSCNLGSINLANFVKTHNSSPMIDYSRLNEIIRLAVTFLDDVISVNVAPLEQISNVSNQIRRIGLGVMGWADMLVQLGVVYGSDESYTIARNVMHFITTAAVDHSEMLARKRGVFPAWSKSTWSTHKPMRNSTLTTIAPTGTLSIIADCSGGIEPLFALAFERRHFLDNHNPLVPTVMVETNKYLRNALKDCGMFTSDRLQEIYKLLLAGKHLSSFHDVPTEIKRIFVTTNDIPVEDHIKMQAAFQAHTHNAVSKTINLPNDASVADIKEAYELAYASGCMGITVYRDGSRGLQVLSTPSSEAVDVNSVREAMDVDVESVVAVEPKRVKLADTRPSVTHKATIGGSEFYITAGLSDSGQPLELFLIGAKQGSTYQGLLDTIGIVTSYALQYGVSIEALHNKLRGTRFTPAGLTINPNIPTTTSVIDYVFRWLHSLTQPKNSTLGLQMDITSEQTVVFSRTNSNNAKDKSNISGQVCPDCGDNTVLIGNCESCQSCGFSMC